VISPQRVDRYFQRQKYSCVIEQTLDKFAKIVYEASKHMELDTGDGQHSY